MSEQLPDYTDDQKAALVWLTRLSRLNRLAGAAIMLARFKPEVWEVAEQHIEDLRATAAAGPGAINENPPGRGLPGGS